MAHTDSSEEVTLGYCVRVVPPSGFSYMSRVQDLEEAKRQRDFYSSQAEVTLMRVVALPCTEAP